MDYFKLIRFQNLLLLAFMLLIFRYGFLMQQNIFLALTDIEYSLFILSMVCIAAGGYVINDIFDQEVDAHNKPDRRIIGVSISEEKGYYAYGALSILGVALGFYLSNVIEKPGFAVFYVLVVALLYVYAASLKQMPVIGNLVVALLAGASIFFIVIFDLYPITYDGNRQTMKVMFYMLKDYALFALVLTFLREIIKDQEDIEGDQQEGLQTLPIVLGQRKTNYITSIIALAVGVVLLIYTFTQVLEYKLWFTVIYATVTVIAPLFWVAIKAWSAREKADYRLMSLVLKLIFFFGILSIAVLTYNMIQNAQAV
jgi:4-hydroxybenzoate polyprenyltransferase